MQLSDVVENPTGAARMAALKRYHILDTDRDAVFDGIAEIAAALLDAPIAVVNFIADDRQWFKAEIGIGQRELPLDVSICRIALPERGIFVVPDLTCDDRFSCNPLVTEAEGLRFYAGTVLESDGVPIGTVCVLDTKPRPDGISDVQRRGLDALAVQAMAALERSAAAGRDRFKLALSEALLAGDDANDMMSVAARMIGEHLGVAQVGFGVVDNGGEYATVGQAWNDGRMPMFAGRWRLEDFGQDRVALLRAGRTLAIDDIHVEDRGKRTVAEAPYALAIRSALSVPLVRENALVAVLFVHHPDARVWRDNEIALIEDCAARLWSSVMRARADERLLQSEATARARAEQIEAIYSAAPVGLAVFDRDMRYVNVNERLAEMNGVSVANHIGKTAREIVPDLAAQVTEAFEQILTGKEMLGLEFEVVTAARPGIVRTCRANYLPMRDEAGDIVGVTVSAEEITDEKATQEALKVSEARFRSIYEHAPTGIAMEDLSGSFVSCNPAFAKLLGFEEAELAGRPFLDLVYPEDRESTLAKIARLVAGDDESCEMVNRFVHKSGEPVWVHRFVSRNFDGSGKLTGLLALVTDLTATRQKEAELADSGALLRSVLDASPDCIKSAGLDGRVEFMNANGMCAMEIDDFGTIAGVEWASLWPAEAREHVARSLKAARTGQSTRFEAYCPTVKGTPKWWDVAVAPILGVDGTPTRIVSISREITDRVQNESQLRASEALFRTLAESLSALLFLGDSNGANTYTNPQFADYTGMEFDTLLGNGWLKTMHPDDRAQVAQTWDLSWRQELPFQVECRFRAAGGEFRTFLVRGNPVRDDNGKIIQWVATFTDIEDAVRLREELATSREELIRFNANLETQVATRTSELVLTNRKLKSEIKRREATQAALIQGKKLEALGQLTAGIAHDFNNILAAIAGGMDLIERRSEDPKIKYITGHCRDAAFRGATVVKQMLAFARQEVLAPRSAKLARLADEIAPLIKQAIPGNIVSIDFPADLPPVLIDPVLLETALLNLAVNARDAMPGGGTLSLTASVSRPEDRNHPAELKAVEAVAIAVRDNGEGMPLEIVQRVTEPFFTTKAPGKGTGLGLAMVYGFIGQSGGAMHIDSRVGEGTTITLYLPLDTAKAEAQPDVVVDTAAPTGVGAVLLVDDDAAVRAVAAEQLRDLGYTITEADGYAAAMTRIEAGGPFDCVVSDVVMPGGDGVTLAAAIRSTRPGLPILLMTGRADGKRIAGEQVLHKPFKLIDLATAVADAIDRPVRDLATVARIASRCRSRCVADMLEHWSAAKFAGKVAAFSAFDADTCSEPHKLAVVIADASQLPIRFTVVSAGKDLENLLDRPMKANGFDERGAEGFGSAEESYRRAVKTRLPVVDYIRMNFGDGGPEWFERLILPYSSGDGLVDRLVSIVVFAKTA